MLSSVFDLVPVLLYSGAHSSSSSPADLIIVHAGKSGATEIEEARNIMTEKKRVAIVGSGISGLAATKSCLEEGLEPTCFEQYESIGGVWYYTEEYREGQGARAFDNLNVNVSRDMFAYSDFPFPPEMSSHPSAQGVHDYLMNYSETFGLNKYIRLSTKVAQITRSRDYDITGTWEVETVTNNGSPTIQIFDCVIVCSGYCKKPFVPDIKGMDTFKGDIQHAAMYNHGESYKNKRVVVVGNGNSSGDMATGIAVFAEKVFYGVGSGMWVVPRVTRNGKTPEYILFTRANFKSMAKVDQVLFDICNDGIGVQRAGYFPSTVPTMSKICVNDVLQFYTMYGKINIHGHLVRLGPREAEFDDGSVVQDVDSVLFATGYQISLDFLNEEIVEENGKMSLYKLVFPLHLPHTTLALVGCQEINAPYTPILELQGRLAARVFSGNHKLPPRQAWRKDIDDRNNMVFALFGRYKYLMPLFPLRDQLASELGVTPSWFDLIRAGPKLAYNYLYGPVFPYQDRLWGPHSWFGARRAIEEALEHGSFGKQPRKSSPPNLKKRSKLLPGVFFLVVSTVFVAAVYRCTREGRIHTF